MSARTRRVDEVAEERWLYKYRPTSPFEMALSPNVKRAVEDWIARETMDNLALVGPAGIGKSALARVLTTQLPCDRQLFRASFDRGVDVIRNQVALFVGTRPFPGSRLRIAVLEEADGYTQDAQRALRNVMDGAPPRARFIITLNDEDKFQSALLSRCVRLDLLNPPLSERLRIIRRILDLEGVTEPPNGLTELASQASDMRQLIIKVESAVRWGIPLVPPEDVGSSLALSSANAADQPAREPKKLKRAKGHDRELLIMSELGGRQATETQLRLRLAENGWEVPQSTLYSDLKRLARNGMIESDGSPEVWSVARIG